jgi:hypothetical protein
VTAPRTEVFAAEFAFGIQWGYECHRCGFQQTGVSGLPTVEEHADSHECPPAPVLSPAEQVTVDRFEAALDALACPQGDDCTDQTACGECPNGGEAA